MKEWAELIGALILVALMIICCVYFVAAIFAAPGYILLLLVGHNDIGFWNSAAAGLGSLIIGAFFFSRVN